MANQPENKRRDFLKISAASIVGGFVATRILASTSIAHAQKPEVVKESDPQAQALGYYIDAKKVDTKKWTKRAGAEGAKQFCYNCSFYQTKGADPKTVNEAPCAIFANKLVAGKGWCNSWTENKAVKG